MFVSARFGVKAGFVHVVICVCRVCGGPGDFCFVFFRDFVFSRFQFCVFYVIVLVLVSFDLVFRDSFFSDLFF